MPAPTDAPTSAEQQELINAGATPVEPDVNAIIAQMQAQMAAQQKFIDSLLAEKGQSSDPVGQALLDLTAHVRARAAALPHLDFSEVLKTLDEETSDPALHATLLHDLLTDIVDQTKHHDLAYVVQLARDYRKTAVKAASVGN